MLLRKKKNLNFPLYIQKSFMHSASKASSYSFYKPLIQKPGLFYTPTRSIMMGKINNKHSSSLFGQPHNNLVHDEELYNENPLIRRFAEEWDIVISLTHKIPAFDISNKNNLGSILRVLPVPEKYLINQKPEFLVFYNRKFTSSLLEHIKINIEITTRFNDPEFLAKIKLFSFLITCERIDMNYPSPQIIDKASEKTNNVISTTVNDFTKLQESKRAFFNNLFSLYSKHAQNAYNEVNVMLTEQEKNYALSPEMRLAQNVQQYSKITADYFNNKPKSNINSDDIF